jgi:DNA-binding NtrC family response regulator
MQKRIVVLDADVGQCEEIKVMLSGYEVTAMQSLQELQDHIIEGDCRVLLIDLDTVPTDNRALAHIKRRHPAIEIIAKSERTFHPELEESLRSHILSCLAKPLDIDELAFWLKSIFHNSAPSAGGGMGCRVERR